MSIFNERFKELKDSKDIMLKDLAADLEITNSKLSYYLNGNSEPPYDLLIKISNYFDVTTDYLTGKSNYKKHEDFTLANSFEKQIAEDIENISDEKRATINNLCIEFYNCLNKIVISENSHKELSDILKAVEIWVNGLDDFIKFVENYKNKDIDLEQGKKAMDNFTLSRMLIGSQMGEYLSEILNDESVDENIKKLITKRTSYFIKNKKNEPVEEIQTNAESPEE